MGGSLIVEILLAVLTVAVAVGTYLGAARAGKAQASGVLADVDAKAYERARESYESAIATLVEHVERLKVQLEQIETEVEQLHKSNRDLLGQVEDLQIANSRLQADRKGNTGPAPKIRE
ncbi:MAG: hypothetical protein ACREHG_10575 [Candidatus Saccharimonadales bacterium]